MQPITRKLNLRRYKSIISIAMKTTKTFFALLVFFFTNIVAFGQTPCVPTFSGTSISIDNFAIHTLVNTYSGVDSTGYISYSDTSFTTTLRIGNSYPITISNKYSAGISGNFAAWIDFNNDNIFDSSERIYYDTSCNHSTFGFVTIPNNTSFIGQRRLRVLNVWATTNLMPCGNYNNGEAEDYLINISNQLDTHTYCLPFNPVNADNFIIDDFYLNTLANTSSGSNYNNYIFYPYTVFTTDLVIGKSYNLSVYKDVMAGNTGGFAMWIDLDDDGEFSGSEKLFYSGPNLYYASGTISIPDDTSFIGKRRLRLRSAWATTLIEPCGLSSSGETEDYIINIVSKNTASVSSYSDNSNDILVYPNPSHGVVNIHSLKAIDEIKITNLLGEVFYQSNPHQNNVSFQVDNEGIYLILITSDNNQTIKKISIVR